jgi:two-component system sensor histidine kinase CiaH
MSGARAHDVRRQSIRVALLATAVVAAAYLVVSVAVFGILTGNLTGQVDQRLTSSLTGGHGPGPSTGPGGGPGLFEPPPNGRPEEAFGPRLIAWTVMPDGSVSTADATDPSLPATLRHVVGPQTASIGGVDMRVAGRGFGDDWAVVAQSLDGVSRAQSTLIVAEVAIGPFLLLVVFAGAVAIGRRVAMPVELARRRELEFTADASHELRTPLSVIEAHTSLALTQDRSAAWYRTAFERVDRESKRMRRLLDDLLWLARFDATEARPNAEPVDLGILAKQTADRFGPVAETRRLALEVVTADDAVIAAPPDWLDRLLGVLLDNACKYAPEGGSVAVRVSVEDGRVALVVDDSGPGIPPAEREHIFARFHRATDAESGAGLGLAIADAIVRATGGRWKIGSSPAGGARMAVSWPTASIGSRDGGGSRHGRSSQGRSAGGAPRPGAGEDGKEPRG